MEEWIRERGVSRSPIWREYELNERLDQCLSRLEEFPVRFRAAERVLRKLLLECFPETREGLPFQIIPHRPEERKRPGCPKVLFVLCGIRNFGDRTLEALDIARRCKFHSDRVEIILYLTLSWSIRHDELLKSTADIFRDYQVVDVCRKEPRVSSPLIFY